MFGSVSVCRFGVGVSIRCRCVDSVFGVSVRCSVCGGWGWVVFVGASCSRFFGGRVFRVCGGELPRVGVVWAVVFGVTTAPLGGGPDP